MRLRWKILLTILLAVAYTMLQWYLAPKLKACETTPVMNQEELQAWYQTYNRRYFADTLPTDVKFQWVDMHYKHRMGETECHLGSCIIRLDPSYNEAFPVAKETLLHEMCHVKNYDEFDTHGRRWQSCMHTLWLDGAFEDLL